MIRTFNLGTFREALRPERKNRQKLILTLEQMRRHFLISGSTGSGKSRTAEAIALDAWEQNVGMAVIDVHGDTVDDVAAHLAKIVIKTGDLSLLERIDYLQWTPTYCPRLDQLAFAAPKGIHPEFRQNFEIAARHAMVDRFASHIQSSAQGTDSFDLLPRLRRTLKAMLAGCAVRCPNLRLPTALGYILLNVSHPRHFEVYDRVRPYLPGAVVAFFQLLHDLESPLKALEQCESALNRNDAFFSPLLTESFGETSETAPVVDFQRIVRERRILLVNLSEGPYFSHQQGVMLARMISSTLIDTILCLRREARPDGFIVLLEEAGEYLHEPFLRYLGATRKYGVIVGICGQDLSTFGLLAPKLISQCGVLVTYNQCLPDDATLLSKRCFYSLVDFEPLLNEVEVEGEMEWLDVEETSESVNESTSNTLTAGNSEEVSEGTSGGTSSATQTGWQKSRSSQEATADSQATGFSSTGSSSRGSHESPVMTGTEIDRMLDLMSTSMVEAAGQTRQDSSTQTLSSGSQDGESGSETETVQSGRSKSKSRGASTSKAEGKTSGRGTSRSKRKVHIPHKKREIRETGQLRAGPTNEQLRRFEQIITGLQPRTAVVNAGREHPVILESRDLPNAYRSAEANAEAVEWLKKQMLRIREYMVIPNLDPKLEDERIERFLAQMHAAQGALNLNLDGRPRNYSPFDI